MDLKYKKIFAVQFAKVTHLINTDLGDAQNRLISDSRNNDCPSINKNLIHC